MSMYNLAVDHRFLIYAALVALPMVLGLIKDKMNLRIWVLIFFYFIFHYLWGYPWHQSGVAGLVLFALFATYVTIRFIVIYSEAISRYGHRGLVFTLQILALGIFGFRAFRAGNNLLLGKSFTNSKHRLFISSPLDPSQPYAVINGGYREANNSEYHVLAKRFALHFAAVPGNGQPAQLKVIAPCEGEVKALFKNDAKAKGPQDAVMMPEAKRFGSSVVMSCFGNEKSEKLVLSNLDPDSIEVKVGDVLKLGQPVALTGRTEYRHRAGLIIHGVYAQSLDPAVLFETGSGVPLRIDGQYYVKNDVIRIAKMRAAAATD